MNISQETDDETACTSDECAQQRAEHLATLGARNVLELCVGPSLRTLATAYGWYGIYVTGNDIDPRWQRAYPSSRWIIGDARSPGIANVRVGCSRPRACKRWTLAIVRSGPPYASAASSWQISSVPSIATSNAYWQYALPL